MCDPLSIRAFAFVEIESEVMLSMHVQIKYFPFNRGRVLTEARLAFDVSKRLLSTFIELPGGNTAATNFLSGKKDVGNVSVMAATGGCWEDLAFMQRASCNCMPCSQFWRGPLYIDFIGVWHKRLDT